MGRLDLAQQAERDRAVGLDDQAAIEGRIGERFDEHFVADVELVGRGRFLRVMR